MHGYHSLTPQEDHILSSKGTELAGTGEYNHFDSEGIFVCKRCDAPLYLSQDKFSSGCGWPSFDQEIEGAVKRIPDPDGERTEIVCTRSGTSRACLFRGAVHIEKHTPLRQLPLPLFYLR